MKPRIFRGDLNPPQWVEFDTNEELQAFIDSISDNTLVQFAINQAKREQIGRDLANDLFRKLQEQNLTETEEAQIVNKISTCMLALLVGSIKGARVICNALTTDAVFTKGRKNYLLGKIDEAIAEL